MNATYNSKDNNRQDSTTVYWFTLTGTDTGTGREFDSEVFGISESGSESTVVDADGYPLTEGDGITIAVRRHAIVTDEMRAQ